MLLLPSTVWNEHYVRMPTEGKVIESDEEWEKCGKWILHNPSEDLKWMDRFWSDLQVLLRDGCLILLKASTVANPNKRGVVLCFTRPGKEEAEWAARAIRSIVRYDYMMYYKTNETTDAGIANRFGDNGISVYMHSFKGRFYVRDSLKRWKLDGRAEEKLPRCVINHWKNLEFGIEKLPSKCEEQELNHESRTWNPEGTGYWHAICSLDEDGNGLTEADRMWAVVERLFYDGVLRKIHCAKSPRTAKIYCHVEDFPVNALTKLPKVVLKLAACQNFMYYRVKTGDYYKTKFVFTSEKEVYCEENGYRKFLFQK